MTPVERATVVATMEGWQPVQLGEQFAVMRTPPPKRGPGPAFHLVFVFLSLASFGLLVPVWLGIWLLHYVQKPIGEATLLIEQSGDQVVYRHTDGRGVSRESVSRQLDSHVTGRPGW